MRHTLANVVKARLIAITTAHGPQLVAARTLRNFFFFLLNSLYSDGSMIIPVQHVLEVSDNRLKDFVSCIMSLDAAQSWLRPAL